MSDFDASLDDEIVSAYLDGEATPVERARVENDPRLQQRLAELRGVATAVSAISDPTLPGRGWEIFIGVITLIAGVVVLASPFESIATLTWVVGIWLVVIGVFEAVSAFGIRKAGKDVAAVREKLTTPPTAEPTR